MFFVSSQVSGFNAEDWSTARYESGEVWLNLNKATVLNKLICGIATCMKLTINISGQNVCDSWICVTVIHTCICSN